MTALQITHQRIDDIPLLLAIMIEMGIPEQIDNQIQPHGLWQGISVGTVAIIWLCYILTEHDHRLVTVREWVNERRELFNRLLGIELRDTDLTDDRLANALTLLGDLGRAEDRPLLRSFLDHAEPEVARAAESALALMAARGIRDDEADG